MTSNVKTDIAKTIVRLENVTFNYQKEKPLFESITFGFGKEFTLIKGPSGSGKSTLLRLLAKLDQPAAGQLYYRQTPYSQCHSGELRTKLVYVQQTPVMLDQTIRDNLLLPFTFKQLSRGPIPGESQLREWLNYFLLEGVSLDDRGDRLSVGQKQRLSLIRALLLQPELLLLDEPTASLDPQSRELVEKLLVRLNRDQDIGIIMITHNDFQPVEMKVRQAFMAQGKLEEI